MRHRISKNKLSRYGSHRKALLRNLTKELLDHGSIVTTVAKAKVLRSFAEKIITKAIKAATAEDRTKSVALRRVINRELNDRKLTNKLVEEIAKKYIGKNGGYVKILRLGFRRGDAAEMALVQLVESETEE